MPEAEKFGVAIAGLGTVGSGVAQILKESRSGEQGLFLKSILEREPENCLLYTSPSPRDKRQSRMPSSA